MTNKTIAKAKVRKEEKYFNVDDEMLGHLESNSKEVILTYRQTYMLQKQNSEKLLLLLISGLSAVFVLTLNNLGRNGTWGAIETGFSLLVILWMACSYALLHFCIRGKSIPMVAASPDKLYFDDPNGPNGKISLGKLKRFSIFQYERMIKDIEVTSKLLTKNLDRVRLAAALSPIISAIAAIIHYSVVKVI